MQNSPYYFKETTATFIIGDQFGNTMAYVPKYVKNARKAEMRAIAEQIVTALNGQHHMQLMAKNLLEGKSA